LSIPVTQPRRGRKPANRLQQRDLCFTSQRDVIK
jgi:hypothetical protein